MVLLTAFRQVTEMTGLNKVTGMFSDKPGERETGMLHAVKQKSRLPLRLVLRITMVNLETLHWFYIMQCSS